MFFEKRVAFIGAGRMCEAILAGALAAGALCAQNVTLCDISEQRLAELSQKYGVKTQLNGTEQTAAKALATECDVLILAVKPQYVHSLLGAVGGQISSQKLLVSIVGGLTLATLESLCPNSRAIRVMPNTPMMAGKGCCGISPAGSATEEDLAACKALFDAVGISVILPEAQMDALTAVSGCGPAFAYLFIEALADGGVEQGLSRDVALLLATQTLAGAAALAQKTGRHPAQLKDDVCSPGGGTIAGVHALESGGFRAAVMDAVAQSKKRMEQLGKS